jgi:hypothetical protein
MEMAMNPAPGNELPDVLDVRDSSNLARSASPARGPYSLSVSLPQTGVRSGAGDQIMVLREALRWQK